MNPIRKYGHVVIWLTFVLTAGILFGMQHHQSDRMGAAVDDLCTVVDNVHDNAKFQFDAATDALDQTLKYLADPKAQDNSALYARVKGNLAVTRSRVAQTRDLLEATKPPATCRRSHP